MFTTIFFILVLYCGSYMFLHRILSSHYNVIRELFNIKTRHSLYTLDYTTNQQHILLSCFASIVMASIMCVAPIIHLFIHLFFFASIDITNINTLLLVTTFIKILHHYDIRNMDTTFNLQPYHWIQLLFILFNYYNKNSIMPSLFQLVDDSQWWAYCIKLVHVEYNNITSNTTTMGHLLEKLINMVERWKQHGENARLVVLGAILIISLLSNTGISMGNELLFYYYAMIKLYF